MNEPVVRLIADVPKYLKKKLMRIALEKDVAIKTLVIEWLESLPELNEKGADKIERKPEEKKRKRL